MIDYSGEYCECPKDPSLEKELPNEFACIMDIDATVAELVGIALEFGLIKE